MKPTCVRTWSFLLDPDIPSDVIDYETTRKLIERVLLDKQRGWGRMGTLDFEYQKASSCDILIRMSRNKTICEECKFSGLSCAKLGEGKVLLNFENWAQCPSQWKDLDTYRAYMVNHEVGHLLGHHSHLKLRNSDSVYPVMFAQTKPVDQPQLLNAFPLDREILTVSSPVPKKAGGSRSEMQRLYVPESTCSPIRGDSEGGGCLYKNELRNLVEAHNRTTTTTKDSIRLSSSESAESLRKKMHEMYKESCPDPEVAESSWIDKNPSLLESLKHVNPKIYNSVTKEAFKPKGTRGKYEWLSTDHIDNVLYQYEAADPATFVYIGCFPSDHYHLYPDALPTDLPTRYQGIVFNLDESHEPGSHWVSLLIENPEPDHVTIQYFDSTGRGPNANIRDVIAALAKTHRDNGKKVKIEISEQNHQKGDTECGVYATFFILNRINGFSMKEINKSKIKDKFMNEYRKSLFRSH
ncbi:hypothetical protein HDU81_005234 [Chytriomyces hyalinus]|nr:hypothetical protein HDU81_005234 [Chytriomyces hyalinus]